MSNFRNKMRTLNQPQREQSVFADPIMSVPVGSVSGRKLPSEEKAALGKSQGLTLSEVNQLTNMGWEQGQAIPENLATQYRHIVTEATKELPATAVQVPEAISIEYLPPPKPDVAENAPTEKHAEKSPSICLHCGNNPYVRDEVDDTDKKCPYSNRYRHPVYENVRHLRWAHPCYLQDITDRRTR
ncbi:hypothetical protein FACS1894170_06670 [Planctomycetales bacterium]|nr:hypothetical protein FACS1894170_06670 [Planctomycetales bacterium]